MKVILAGILGAIVLFVWSAASWMVLPWHMKTIHTFNDEKSVVAIIQANATESGVYMLPMMDDKGTLKNPELAKGPTIFAAIKMQPMNATMTTQMVISFLAQLVPALFVAWILCLARGLSYFGRVGLVLLFGIAGAVASQIPLWNWFGFDEQYISIMMADIIIGWFLAGLVMAGLVCRSKK